MRAAISPEAISLWMVDIPVGEPGASMAAFPLAAVVHNDRSTLEGYGPSQPCFTDINAAFTAPTERAPSRASASNGPSVSGQAWRVRSLAAVLRRYQRRFHGADGAGALQGIGQQWPIGFGPGLEGYGPSQPCFTDINAAFTAPTERAPPGNRPAMAHRFRSRPGGSAVSRSRASPISPPLSRRRRSGRPPGHRPAMAHRFRSRPGGLRSLAAVLHRYQRRFHGADGAGALQGIGQ